MQKKLENLSKNSKFNLNSTQIMQFNSYFNLLIEWNKKFNLTRILDKNEVYDKHFLDSIFPEKFIPKNSSVIDIGAGAGFPSLPLAIVRQDCSFTLVDSLNKRVIFLQEVINNLDLKNAVAYHSRIEDYANTHKEQFDICVARAVAQLNTLVEYSLPLIKEGGLLIAYKSENCEEEIKNAEKAIKILGGKLISQEKYSINDSTIHSVLLIKKVGRSPDKYPRGQNKPRLSPIV